MLCARCEHLNPVRVNECEECHAHLFLTCKECGEGNERTRTRCRNCGHRLHRGLVSRCRRRLAASSHKLTAVKILLFGLALVLAYNFIRLVGAFRLPEL